jgi:acid phosphatase (class A)
MMGKKKMMMRFVVGMLATTLLVGGTVSVQAQTPVKEPANIYFTAKEMPDMRKFMPAPPDTFGIQWTHDIMRYYWGKDLRIKDPERAKMARQDAESNIEWMMKEFSVPFGLQMSKEETPEMYRLLKDATSTARKICTDVKKFYARKRPFLRFHESTLTPEEEEFMSNGSSYSYPSGHALMGWCIALLLSEINPERADTLFARAYMYGDSRVIVGAHWQTDVDAGRLAATVAYGKMHTHPLFLEQLEKAKKEFCRLKGRAMPGVQKGDIEKYYTTEEMPNLIKCLPAPPDTLNEYFTYDLMRYFWGKDQRVTNPERAKVARRDGIWNPIDTLFSSFNEALGMTISKENTPAIWKLLTRSLVTTDQMRVAPKAFYHRTRPYVRFHEHILTYDKEEDEVELGKEGSYPSGHTSRGWATALLLSEVCPEHANEILKRGWDYGESRVIVGAHWQTDVDASRMGASIGYGALQSNPTFREDMKAAQQEYMRKKNMK